MKFSTKATYGLRALTRLAENYGQGSLSLARIAEEEKISLGYLERIFAMLKKRGIVKAIRGSSGGYTLSRDPRDIDIYNVLDILEGGFKSFHCVDDDGKVVCGNKVSCGAAVAIARIQKSINESLTELKLSELIR